MSDEHQTNEPDALRHDYSAIRVDRDRAPEDADPDEMGDAFLRAYAEKYREKHGEIPDSLAEQLEEVSEDE